MLLVLLQANTLTVAVVLGMTSVAYPTISYSQENSDTHLLDNLKEKYDLNNPRRNHQQGTLPDKITNQMNPVSNDISTKLQGMLNEANSSNKVYDFSSTQNTASPETILQQQRREALAIGNSHGSPDVSDDGNINLEYSKEGTRKLTRDQNGNLIVETVENVDQIERVSGVGQRDLVSSEVDNTDHVFETPEGYGDEESIRNNVSGSHNRYRAGTTSSARAYQTITAEIERGVNTTLDPDSALFQPSQDTFNQVNNNQGEFFQSCSTSTEDVNRELNFPVKTKYQCQTTDTTANPFFCEVERSYRVPIIVTGTTMKSCGVGCFEWEFGEEENNYYEPASGCAVYSDSRDFNFNLTDGIELSRVTTTGYVDDHLAFTVDGKLAASVVDGVASYSRPLPSTSYANCDHGQGLTLGRSSIAGDKSFGFIRHVTQGVKNAYNIGWNVLVGDRGEVKGSIQFHFTDTTGKGFGESFTQYPEGCLDKTGAIGSGTGGGSATQCAVGEYVENGSSGPGCYSDGFPLFVFDPSLPSGGSSSNGAYASATGENDFCRFDGWTVLETGSRGFPAEVLDDMRPMFEGDTGNMTWKANLDGYRCDPLKSGQYCYTDPETLEGVCLDWDELQDIPDMCEEYSSDPSCSEVKRECTTEGWYDGSIGWKEGSDVISSDEYCFNETVTYECEVDNTVPYSTSLTTSSCDAALPCVGGNCGLGEDETNEKFVEAAMIGSVIQNADGDRACSDPSDPSTCTIFEGEAEYCSWEVTGLGTDCCESPGGINILAYVSGANGLLKANRLAADGVFGETAQQGADAVINFADQATGYVTDAVSSAYNSVMGTATSTASADVTGGVVSAALEGVKQQLFETVYNALPEELASQLITQTAANEVTGQTAEYALNETLASTLSFIGTAYAVYSLIKIGLQLLTMCDDNEMDMGVKLAQKLCFSVGNSYCSKDVLGLCYQKRQDHCCYNSILARIIMEQAGPLIGKDMSSCAGLTQQEFSLLDFNQIDLSEWIGLMIESGEMKTEADEQSLTGGGELVETECETWEEMDPNTGEVVVQDRCFSRMEGGRILNAENRQTVSERTLQRTDGASSWSQNARDSARDAANNLDCSVSPRPPVCDFMFNPKDTDSGP
ncbi:MAG: conjugal transfer mating pair stabilization protein TraN [Oleiphilaceae bacterium]|jgi:conjugal transfer mating pair stabilization protein TraN